MKARIRKDLANDTAIPVDVLNLTKSGVYRDITQMGICEVIMQDDDNGKVLLNVIGSALYFIADSIDLDFAESF